MKSICPRLFRANLLIVLLTLVLPPAQFCAGWEDSPLQKEMEGINRSVRQLGRQIDDPTKKDSSRL
jgi:hypothetical protein